MITGVLFQESQEGREVDYFAADIHGKIRR